MPLVTLIGEKIAKKDMEFKYIGPNSECKNCKLKTVCFHLKPGRSYIITNVRDKRHNCNVHEGNAVIVEVSELPLIAIINKKESEGTKISIKPQECDNTDCICFELCTDKYFQNNKKYEIKRVIEKVECPEGNELYKVELID